jgi:hypothetical protein
LGEVQGAYLATLPFACFYSLSMFLFPARLLVFPPYFYICFQRDLGLKEKKVKM